MDGGGMEDRFSPVTMEVWSSFVSDDEDEEEEEEKSSSSLGEEVEEAHKRRHYGNSNNNNNVHNGNLCGEVTQVLCSERVGQITKTYHDIKAVTHLLEEKERDLELAARIGQSLLKQNRELTARNEVLDEQLDIAKEEIAQLRHELSMRDDLLQFYASSEEVEAASESRSPIRRNESASSLNSLTNLVHYDFLHQKLKGLEDENRKLRCEASDLESETTNYEEQEQELVMVCVEELTTVNKQVVDLSEELARKVEDSYRQQEEISSLLAQIVDLQARCKALANENEEVNQHLTASRECQLQLKSELKDLQDKYTQCGDMLREAREDIKNLRNKSLPNSTVQRYSALAAVFPMDSLAAEIEGTFRKGLDSPAPIEYKNHPWRVFETVKVANRLRSQCHSPALPGSSPVSTRSSRNSTPRTSFYGSDNTSLNLEDRLYSHHIHKEDGNDVSGPKRLGQPGTPGGRDLEAALQCLSARQEKHSSERPFFDVERERKLRALAKHCEDEEGGEREGSGGREGEGEVEGSSGFLTPGNDSVGSAASSSTGTNYSGTNYSNGSSSNGGSSCSRSYLPDRLQIVKPLEGSVTLHQWQQLAKPDLGGILQPRPGVLTKDFRVLETDAQHVYSLNDLEEDDLVQLPAVHKRSMVSPSGPNLPQTSYTHTVTTCQALHPSILIPSLSSSLPNVSLSACGNTEHVTPSSGSQQHFGLPFDPHPGRPTSTSTTSSLGLLELLREQGISASTCHHHHQQQQQQPLHPSTFHYTKLAHPMVTGKGMWSMPSKDDEDQMRTTSVFSFNLVEKLQRLGLHQVVAWGTVGTSGGEREEVVSPHPPP